MAGGRKTVGFDRRVSLVWLNATAAWAAEGLSESDIRSRLERLLHGEVAGEGPHSAKGKTITVLLHIWQRVPKVVLPLRAEGLAMIGSSSKPDLLPLHWGMCLATYPFFGDVAGSIGRLLALQKSVAMSQIQRRLTEQWGERTTVIRAVQRVTRSLVDWGVLLETSDKGVFSAGARLSLGQDRDLTIWLMESGLTNAESAVVPFRSLVSDTRFFPFQFEISVRDFSDHPRLEVHIQGLDESLIAFRTPAPVAQGTLPSPD